MDDLEARWTRFREGLDLAEYDVEADGCTIREPTPLRRATVDDVDRVGRFLWDAGLLSPDDRDWLQERLGDDRWIAVVDGAPAAGVALVRAHVDANGQLALRATFAAGEVARLLAALRWAAGDHGLGFTVGPVGFAEAPPSHRETIARSLDERTTLDAVGLTPEEATAGIASLLTTARELLDRRWPWAVASTLDSARRWARALDGWICTDPAGGHAWRTAAPGNGRPRVAASPLAAPRAPHVEVVDLAIGPTTFTVRVTT